MTDEPLSGIFKGTVWEIPAGGDAYSIPVKRVHTLIVGSGAASLGCAVRLHSFGITDTAVLTDNLYGGTSRNTGSDKQTYFKMSDSELQPDSPYDMAEAMVRGGCMHGDIALTEALNSLNCFYNLISMGVDFPFNKYGGYTGYRTDHDENKRGVSSGPYTSKKIFDALLAQVRARAISVFDYCRAQFLKGYQWPFDPEKLEIGITWGSALNSGQAGVVSRACAETLEQFKSISDLRPPPERVHPLCPCLQTERPDPLDIP